MQHCGAKTRKGTPCKSAAMENGRCRMHGGLSPKGVDHPSFKTGQHSRYRHLLSEKMQAHIDDSDPLDLLPELEVQRVLFASYLNSYNGMGNSIPAQERERLIQWASEITRTAERVNKMRNETALTKAEVMYLAARIADVVSEFIPDADRQQAFIDKLFAGLSPSIAGALGSGSAG